MEESDFLDCRYARLNITKKIFAKVGIKLLLTTNNNVKVSLIILSMICSLLCRSPVPSPQDFLEYHTWTFRLWCLISCWVMIFSFFFPVLALKWRPLLAGATTVGYWLFFSPETHLLSGGLTEFCETMWPMWLILHLKYTLQTSEERVYGCGEIWRVLKVLMVKYWTNELDLNQ